MQWGYEFRTTEFQKHSKIWFHFGAKSRPYKNRIHACGPITGLVWYFDPHWMQIQVFDEQVQHLIEVDVLHYKLFDCYFRSNLFHNNI